MSKNIVATIVFNDEVTQEKVDELVEEICLLLNKLDITAVIQVDEQEITD